MLERVEHLADLATIGNGAVAEKFAQELRAVLENIRDPNTEAKAKRKVVIEFVFSPTEDRERVHTYISARSVMAASKPTGDMLFIGRVAGETVATVLRGGPPGEDPNQGVLPIDRKTGES